MNIISILHHKIHVLRVRSTPFGKKNLVTASANIPQADMAVFNVDTWALHLKKALEQVDNKLISGKIRLILGQRFWQFTRITVPPDINDTALEQFIKNELAKINPNFDNQSLSKFFIADHKGTKTANVFYISNSVLESIKTLLNFYDLKAEEIYPEAVLIFRLFETTLNKQKEETALFLEYEAGISSGILFDSVGLYKEKPIQMETNQVVVELKKLKKSEKEPIARLILGGELSTKVRQDNFTKETGIWTNPLQKVLLNSLCLQDAQKFGVEDKFLEFHREISLLNSLREKQAKEYVLKPITKKFNPLAKLTIRKPDVTPFKKYFKYIFLIIISFAVSFVIIFLIVNNINKIKLPSLPKKQVVPALTVVVTKKPEPTKAPVTLAKEDIVIEIQNGVGTTGLAGSVNSELTDLGYTIESVGNADSYEYKNTVIITKNKVLFELIAKDLKTYEVTKPKYEKTASDKTTIIIGTDFKLP